MRYRTALLLLTVCALVALTAGLLAPRPRPVRADGAAAISSSGNHTCVLSDAGGVRCWGANTVGEVGDGTTSTRRRVPTEVVGLQSGVKAISAGGAHSCALLDGGTVKCWGLNFYGQIGDGTSGGTTLDPLERPTPVDVCAVYDEVAEQCTELLTGVVGVGAGGLHTCAVMSAGGVTCWGRNEFGQVGDGTLGDGDPDTQDNNRPTPVGVCAVYDDDAQQCSEPLSGIIAVEGGGFHTCAVTAAATAECWGSNIAGQLGDGAGGGTLLDPVRLPTPVDVCQLYDEEAGACGELLTGVAVISAGSLHTCALVNAAPPAEDYGIKCWGAKFNGALGDNNVCGADDPLFRCLTPTDVLGLESGATAVTVGDGHTCALNTASVVKCWGDNLNPGQVGDGRRCGLECPTPVDVCADAECAAPLVGVAAVAAGFIHTCALLQTGAVKCWGGNFWGQLGSESCCNDFITPVDVVGLGIKPAPTFTATPTATLTPTATPTPTSDPESTIEEQLDGLTEVVEGIGLTRGAENSLIAKLNHAARLLAAGKPCTAANVLRAFIRQVDAMERSGRLSNAQPESLISPAAEIEDQLLEEGACQRGLAGQLHRP